MGELQVLIWFPCAIAIRTTIVPDMGILDGRGAERNAVMLAQSSYFGLMDPKTHGSIVNISPGYRLRTAKHSGNGCGCDLLNDPESTEARPLEKPVDGSPNLCQLFAPFQPGEPIVFFECGPLRSS